LGAGRGGGRGGGVHGLSDDKSARVCGVFVGWEGGGGGIKGARVCMGGVCLGGGGGGSVLLQTETVNCSHAA